MSGNATTTTNQYDISAKGFHFISIIYSDGRLPEKVTFETPRVFKYHRHTNIISVYLTASERYTSQ